MHILIKFKLVLTIMIINKFLEKFKHQIDTIVHVGAHLAEELEPYMNLNPKKIVWIEGDPDLFNLMEKKLILSMQTHCIPMVWLNTLVSDKDGDLVEFKRFNNQGASSSIFSSTELASETWPGLSETGEKLILRTRRLDSILKSLSIEIKSKSALVLDIQGAELLALKGLGDFLGSFDFIEVEVSKEEIYKGAPLYPEINAYLINAGYEQISETPWHGDVVYKKKLAGRPIQITQEQANRVNSALASFSDYRKLIKFGNKSKSQLGQDIFVLSELGFKRDGFFVEFGATNGLDLSNTYLLESDFGWSGILAEPATSWHESLRLNRKAKIDTRCVWSQSGDSLVFNETDMKEFSTIDHFSSADLHEKNRLNGSKYIVDTVSLLDLLDELEAPRIIDYLSIDTEGSEYSILENFDFSKYSFRVITCEHNYTPMRDKIKILLESKGYVRKYTNLSKFDDWYVLNTKL